MTWAERQGPRQSKGSQLSLDMCLSTGLLVERMAPSTSCLRSSFPPLWVSVHSYLMLSTPGWCQGQRDRSDPTLQPHERNHRCKGIGGPCSWPGHSLLLELQLRSVGACWESF